MTRASTGANASRRRDSEAMSGFISRGFGGRRRQVPEEFAGRLPPGQYFEPDFPVLSAGPTPRVEWDTWSFEIDGLVNQSRQWDSKAVGELPFEQIPCDIHCVTKWSKLGTAFGGVSMDVFVEAVQPQGAFAMVHCHGGYTTNLALDDLTGGKAWIVTEHEGAPLPAVHGGPARLLVPHLYFWKSAKWVAGLHVMADEEPGFWETNGYHIRGDPWREERYWND
jgi:DMSO/TMAO reductase YedYZ molybdopterin-dependent catalytic subunit